MAGSRTVRNSRSTEFSTSSSASWQRRTALAQLGEPDAIVHLAAAPSRSRGPECTAHPAIASTEF
jgi:hypothetical protein